MPDDAANGNLRAGCLTARGSGGLSVYRVAGDEVMSLVGRVFRAADGRGTRPGDLRFGHLVLDGEVVDEAVVAVGTCGRHAEISTHGGRATQAAVERLLGGSGVELVAPRAVAGGGSVGPGRAVAEEARDALVAAHAVNAVMFFLAALEGGLPHEVDGLRRALLAADPPAGQALQRRIEVLLARAPFGRAFHEPPLIALAGPTNAGKSTLANQLLREERCIVTSEPGTTRDVIRAPVSVLGHPFFLADCAGLRDDPDPVERDGIDRARAAVSEAALVLLVVDGSQPLPDLPAELLRDPRLLPVINKADRPQAFAQEAVERRCGKRAVRVSALAGTGLEALERQVVFRSAFRGPAALRGACPFTARQEAALSDAAGTAPEDPRAAAGHLARLLDGPA